MKAVIRVLKNKQVVNIKVDNVSKIIASKVDDQEGIEIYSDGPFVDFLPFENVLSIIMF